MLGAERRLADAAVDRVEIRLLGPLQVRRADATLVEPREWRTGKTADLVRLLALRVGEPIAVDTLLDALWPAVDERRGRASLRTAASQIRRVVGPNCLERRLGGLLLRDAWVDVVVFRSLAADARRCFDSGQLARSLTVTREAEALYIDDLRAHDDGAQWATRARLALAAAYRDLLADAADAAVELGWMRDAVDFATRSLVLDPYSERAYRALIQAYAGLGEVERALREYERCRVTLAEELGADPSAQTRAVRLQLLSGEPAEPATPPFVGRDSELRWLRGTLRSALDGREPAVVCLIGPDGAGKSRLAARACRDLRSRVIRIGRAVPAADDELAARNEARRGRPAVVVVEDLHQAGPERLRDLGRMVADVEGAGALVVTSRSWSPRAGKKNDEAHQGDGPVTDLIAAVGWPTAQVHRLSLAPLGAEDVARLAGELLTGNLTSPLVATLVENSGGLPGRLVQIVRRWSREGRIAVTATGLALLPPRDGSAGDGAVRPLLARLVRQLSRVELDVLHLVAVLDARVSAETVVPLLGEDQGVADPVSARASVRALLDHLVDLSVLAREPAGYSFRHPLLRDAVLSWLRPSARRRLHRLVAERAHVPPARRIEHWLSAGEPRLACAAAMDASTEAMAEGRYDDARSHLLRICALGDLPEASPVDRVSLFERLADVCAVLGRREEAGAAYAVATSEPEVENRLRAALEKADRGGDPAARAEARLLLAALVCTPRRQLAQSRLWTRQAMSLTVDPAARARVMLESCRASVLLGEGQLVEQMLERGRALAEEAGDIQTWLEADALRALVAHDLGRGEFTHLSVALDGLVEAMFGTGVTLLLPEAAARLVAIEAVVDPAAAREHFDLFDWALGGEGGARESFLRLLARAAIRRAEGRYEGAATAAADAAGMTESRPTDRRDGHSRVVGEGALDGGLEADDLGVDERRRVP